MHGVRPSIRLPIFVTAPRLARPWRALSVLVAVFLAAAIQPAPAGQMPYSQGLLWKITKRSGVPSYVFGTMHVSDERVRDIPNPVRRALKETRSLSVEMISDPKDRIRTLELMVYTNGRTLNDVLGPTLFARTVRAIAPLGLGAEDIKMFKPWYVSVMLGTPPDEAMRQSGGRIPLDAALVRRAARMGHRLHGLETFDEHFGLFDNMSEADQIKMLELAVGDSRRVTQYYERMVRHYVSRDLGALMKLWGEYKAGLDPSLRQAFENKLLHSRNRIMVKRMQKRLREGRAMIAVGAAHLPGEKGILNLLAQRGYKVSRIY